jgi:hypothetical protein
MKISISLTDEEAQQFLATAKNNCIGDDWYRELFQNDGVGKIVLRLSDAILDQQAIQQTTAPDRLPQPCSGERNDSAAGGG